jgi:hypothetical protein
VGGFAVGRTTSITQPDNDATARTEPSNPRPAPTLTAWKSARAGAT